MFIRIAGIKLKPPFLQPLIEPDAGLQVYCKAPEGVYDESGAKKLLAMKGFTQSVKWEDKAGVKHKRIMRLLVAKTELTGSPDGKKITHYYFTLVDV